MGNEDRQTERIAITVEVSGLVQGVGYRYFVQNCARDYGVTGWVKNQSSGAVAALFEGEEKAVLQLIDCCRQGPHLAEVERLDMKVEEYRGDFSDFLIHC